MVWYYIHKLFIYPRYCIFSNSTFSESCLGAIAVVISVVFAPTLIFPIEYVRIQIRWMPYHGIFHCITQTFQEGGVLRFYTGFADHYSRIAPYLAVLLLLINFWIYILNFNGIPCLLTIDYHMADGCYFDILSRGWLLFMVYNPSLILYFAIIYWFYTSQWLYGSLFLPLFLLCAGLQAE